MMIPKNKLQTILRSQNRILYFAHYKLQAPMVVVKAQPYFLNIIFLIAQVIY